MSEEAPDCCRRSFGASIKDTARRLLEDPSIAPRDVTRQRMEICKECPRFIEVSQTCEICGCFMPLKTVSANMRCPLDHWVEWKRGD